MAALLQLIGEGQGLRGVHARAGNVAVLGQTLWLGWRELQLLTEGARLALDEARKSG